MTQETTGGHGSLSETVKPLKYRSVLIVTYGRSGSTLLQGLLNSIPGCLVRGENYNLCYGLFSAYRSLRMAKDEIVKAPATQPTSPWFGAPSLSPELFMEDARALVRRQLLAGVDPASISCLGFKEIRHPNLMDPPKYLYFFGKDLHHPYLMDLPRYLDFLEDLFPDVAFVFLTRELVSVSKSAWWREKKPEDVQRMLTRFEQTGRTWANKRTNVFHIDYRDMVEHSAKISALFSFLGADYDRDAVQAVLAIPHSYESKKGDGKGKGEGRNWLKVRLTGREVTRVLFVDPLPERPERGEAVNIGGGILANTDLPDGLRLMLNQNGECREVQWCLPSPGVAKNFPDDALAATARFRLPVSDNFAPAELLLEAPDGQSWVVAHLNKGK